MGFDPLKNKTVTPIHDRVLVKNMNFEMRTTKNGIILRSDDGVSTGVRPRWGQVYAKGPENVEAYSPGDWILVEHGRWTRGINFEHDEEGEYTLRMVEAESVMLWSEEEPNDMTINKG